MEERAERLREDRAAAAMGGGQEKVAREHEKGQLTAHGRVSSDDIRLYDAYGCTNDFPMEHYYRDAVLATILSGTPEMHKMIIGCSLLDINAVA